MSRFSDSLPEQARHLAERDKGRPSQANLRRAVSSAYYSLFHLLCDDSAGAFVGKTSTDAKMRVLVTRAFVHTQMREACLDVGKSNPSPIFQPFFAALNPLSSRELQRLARAFVELQMRRHRADYDLSTPFTRAEVLLLLQDAEQGRDDWNALKVANPDLARFFSVLLLLRASLGARK